MRFELGEYHNVGSKVAKRDEFDFDHKLEIDLLKNKNFYTLLVDDKLMPIAVEDFDELLDEQHRNFVLTSPLAPMIGKIQAPLFGCFCRHAQSTFEDNAEVRALYLQPIGKNGDKKIPVERD